MDVILSDQLCKKRQRLQDIVLDMKLQCDTYLQEVHKAYISLIGIGTSLSDFNLLGSLVD